MPGGDCFFQKIYENMFYVNKGNGEIIKGSKILNQNPLAEIYKEDFLTIDPLNIYTDIKGKKYKGIEIIQLKRIKSKDFKDFRDFEDPGDFWTY